MKAKRGEMAPANFHALDQDLMRTNLARDASHHSKAQVLLLGAAGSSRHKVFQSRCPHKAVYYLVYFTDSEDNYRRNDEYDGMLDITDIHLGFGQSGLLPLHVGLQQRRRLLQTFLRPHQSTHCSSPPPTNVSFHLSSKTDRRDALFSAAARMAGFCVAFWSISTSQGVLTCDTIFQPGLIPARTARSAFHG